MAFLDTLFFKRHHPKPSPYYDTSSSTIPIDIHSNNRHLTEEEQDLIRSVVTSDIKKRISLEDIAIDIIVYSGTIEQVHIIRTPKSIKVIIG